MAKGRNYPKRQRKRPKMVKKEIYNPLTEGTMLRLHPHLRGPICDGGWIRKMFGSGDVGMVLQSQAVDLSSHFSSSRKKKHGDGPWWSLRVQVLMGEKPIWFRIEQPNFQAFEIATEEGWTEFPSPRWIKEVPE